VRCACGAGREGGGMTDRRKLITSLTITLVLVGLNLVAFNVLMGRTSMRLDLTEEGVYSITPATERLLKSLEEDCHIYGYFSKRTHAKLAPLVPQIADLLDEYEAVSGGRVKVRIVDPKEDPEAEQEATERYGVTSAAFQLVSKYEAGIVNAYFHLVIKYGDQYVRYGFDDLIEIEPEPDGDFEVTLRNIEYDLTRAIKKVVFGFRGGAELFERVEEPVRFTAVMTPGALPDVLEDVPEAVRSAAQELSEKGGDKFVYEELDPTNDEELQYELLQRFGAQPMALGLFSEESFYLYGFLQSGGRIEQLALTGEGVTAASVREAVESSLRRQTPGFLKTVGLVLPAPAIPPELLMQMQMQGRMPPQPPPEFEQLRTIFERDYQVQDVDLSADQGVPSDVDILVVLKPKDLDELSIYNLDQYLMRGGRVVLCAGGYEARLDMQGLRISRVESGLEDWLASYGVTVEPTMVLDEQNQPYPIPDVEMTPIGPVRTYRYEPYPYLVQVAEKGLINREISSNLGAVGIYWGSPVEVDTEKSGELQVLELLRSSDRSWTDDNERQAVVLDVETPAETESHLLGVALSGRFKSYWAGKESPRAPEEPLDPLQDPADPDFGATPPVASTDVPLEESPETRLVVIGNAEFLSDFVASSVLAADPSFFGENLAFMQNLIDWTNLDNEMLQIRSRGATSRRLGEIPQASRVTIEVANYLAAAAILLGLAAWFHWRRRHTVPVRDTAAPRGAEG
jgi:ABC-2 type transport system permease protein